ncbi:sugar ABC transporter ATP-binding protein [Horticoccus sp. 23ND18S-11]|uniref:sugar ABC transporter ATP-binding protein n=1 Tax=Horticoccus sp. 23ND18S-11 TaxID=3391832 RepID=UPI0039C9F747
MAPASSTSVLALRGIRKAYPGVVALDGVDLDLAAGEVHVLLGENGAGKSTLMKIISGAVRRDAGEILVDGAAVDLDGPRHAQALGIGIIYQEFNLIPHLRAGENILLGREPSLVPGVIDQRALMRDAQRQLDELGVAIDARAVVSRLSVAQQQMVEVAKALSLNARVLIMDEPTSALTEQEIKELFAAIRRLRARGVAIVYISHRMEELFAIGDRVTVLRDGRHVGTRAIGETTMSELVRLMVGRDLKDQFPKQRAAVGEEVLRVEHLRRDGVLHDINFALRRGEVVGLAGLMGSGRTELARAVFGADAIDGGRVLIRGEERTIASPRDAIDLGLGLLTEDRKQQGLVLVLSVQENMCLPSVGRFSRGGVMQPARESEATARRIQELRIKTPGPHQRVVHLSGGNQQKVVLGKWLCTEADILIFDEPTRGIDVGAKVEIYQLMNQLAARGAAILMISSELPEILGMSDRILVMHAGRIAGEFPAAEATQEKLLAVALGNN